MAMTNDPISDMLTRIRNASMVGKPEVLMPYSKMKHQIALILQQAGYLGTVSKVEPEEPKKGAYTQLRVGLKYDQDRQSVIRQLRRVSKPGLRVYRGKDQLPVVLNNLGIAVISTSQGLMSSIDARKKGVGGEIICEVY
jgi:small subunit ribosomal protein S8